MSNLYRCEFFSNFPFTGEITKMREEMRMEDEAWDDQLTQLLDERE